MYQGKYLAGRKPGAVPTPPQPKKQKQKQKKRITLGTVIFYFLDKRGITPKTRKWVLWSFAAVYIVGTVFVYQNWGDIVSCAGVLLYLLAITQSQSSKYRRYICLNTLLWMIYDITILAFGSLIAHGVEFTSALIGIIRLDVRKKDCSKEEHNENL